MSNRDEQPSSFEDGYIGPYSTFAGTAWQLGERIAHTMVYTSAYIVLIAVSEVATVLFATSLPPNPSLVVIGLVAFAVYTGDRIADADTDEATNPGQAGFVRRYGTILSILSAAAYGLAVALAVFGGPVALTITLVPGAFWVFYATDWLPSTGFVSRLKERLIVNSSIVALAWAVSAVLLPLSFADAPVTPTAAVIFGYLFLDTFVNTEIPNLRDMEGDAAIGVSTLPTTFGVRRTRQILYGLDAVLVVGVCAAYAAAILSLVLTLAILAGLAYGFGIAALVGRTDRYGLLSVACEIKHVFVFGLVVVLAATL